MALKEYLTLSLNPYSTGRYSTSGFNKIAFLEDVKVLILILLEDTLRDNAIWLSNDALDGLNPYSTGRYSTRIVLLAASERYASLNPYSTGRYSTSFAIF